MKWFSVFVLFLISVAFACDFPKYRAIDQASVKRATAPAYVYDRTQANGPLGWGNLATYGTCSSGFAQSPLNINQNTTFLDTILPLLQWSATEITTDIHNNGHTFQVDGVGNSVTISGGPLPPGDVYALQQFHFHSPGEHHLNGQATTAEIHFLFQSLNPAHQGTNDPLRLAVIGMFYQEGPLNTPDEPFLNQFITDFPSLSAGGSDFAINSLVVDFATVFNGRNINNYYTYPGSLTTPPCNEVVTWIVLDSPTWISPAQAQYFVTSLVTPINNRPTQAANGRVVARPFSLPSDACVSNPIPTPGTAAAQYSQGPSTVSILNNSSFIVHYQWYINTGILTTGFNSKAFTILADGRTIAISSFIEFSNPPPPPITQTQAQTIATNFLTAYQAALVAGVSTGNSAPLTSLLNTWISTGYPNTDGFQNIIASPPPTITWPNSWNYSAPIGLTDTANWYTTQFFPTFQGANIYQIPVGVYLLNEDTFVATSYLYVELPSGESVLNTMQEGSFFTWVFSRDPDLTFRVRKIVQFAGPDSGGVISSFSLSSFANSTAATAEATITSFLAGNTTNFQLPNQYPDPYFLGITSQGEGVYSPYSTSQENAELGAVFGYYSDINDYGYVASTSGAVATQLSSYSVVVALPYSFSNGTDTFGGIIHQMWSLSKAEPSVPYSPPRQLRCRSTLEPVPLKL